MKNKYTAKFFRDDMPEWKRKKDPITSRIFYRRVSFYIASIMARMNISANTVSYFSIFIALFACIGLMIPNFICNVIGAILVNVWLISDCVDGDLARSVKKQPFGDFADSVSSYILVALLCTSLGVNTYLNGGLLVKSGLVIFVILGSIASSADTLMRLIYQKYKATERGLADEGKITIEEDKRTDINQTSSLLVRLESDFGVGGILPILVLVGTIFKANDIIVIYCLGYYGLSSLLMIVKYIRKAIIKTNQIETNGE